jgi:hypothetical protein
MIQFNDIKIGDYMKANYEGIETKGEVTNLNHNEKQVCFDNGVQEFWFAPESLQPIVLDEVEMLNLKFVKQIDQDGSVKYMKGAFRVVTPKHNDFSSLEIWYREDRRHNPSIKYVHQLQNHYLDMTKIHLTKDAI